ncbi:MAG: AraC family transcriptional regulator [Polyangiales bacterium]
MTARSVRARVWSGVAVEAVDWRCARDSRFELTSQRYRVGFVLEQSGGPAETRCDPEVSRGFVQGHRPFVSITPPGVQLWACGDSASHTRSLSIAFSRATWCERLAGDVRGDDLSTQLNLVHGPLHVLADLLARECRAPGTYGELYGDGLLTAIFVELARLGRAERSHAKTHGLAPRQLRLALEYLEAHRSGPISLGDLAQLTGLSPAYFGRAFKRATGVPPYRWHLNARIREAQRLLLAAHMTIAEVATATGFADQAHFTRAFTKISGATPAAWRRDRRA